MQLREVVQRFGFRTNTEFARAVKVPVQGAWIYWHGMRVPGKAMTLKIHQGTGIPLEVLYAVELSPRGVAWRERKRAQSGRAAEVAS